LDSKINFIASLVLSKELINSQQPLILNIKDYTIKNRVYENIKDLEKN